MPQVSVPLVPNMPLPKMVNLLALYFPKSGHTLNVRHQNFHTLSKFLKPKAVRLYKRQDRERERERESRGTFGHASV